MSEKLPADAGLAAEASQASHEGPKSDKSISEQMSASAAYMRVFSYGTPNIYIFETIAFLAACGSGVALALVNLVLGNFITLLSDSSSSQHNAPSNFMSEVSKQSLYFVYIGVARFVLTYIYSTIMTYNALKLSRNLRQEFMRSALRQDISFFDHGSAGSISMQATSNGRLIQSGTSEKLGQMIQAISTFIAAFVIAFVSQWKLTLILICVVPAVMIMVGSAGGIDAGIETQILKVYAQAGAYAESSLGNIRAIHAFNLGSRIVDRYATYLDEARILGRKKNILYGLLFAGEYFVMFAGMGLAFWQGIAMIARGEVDGIGTVFTVLFSVVIAAAMLNSVAPNMVTFTRAATAASELFTLIDRQSEIDPFDTVGERPSSPDGSIDIQGVTFRYPTRPDVTALDDFSLVIPAGKVTALVGTSGSGKSTIVGLLERWYNPSSGKITLDGRPLSTFNLHWLRTNMRLVQQEPVLFNDNVYNNIRHGLVGTPWEQESQEQTLNRVKDAARTAFAHDFIEELPQGYNTRIGERGGLLSGGQKQRIAIARSIISKPRILLLDEATSALDPHAETIVQRALDEVSKDRTTIVIAHKLNTIQDADNIVVMKQGRIVEQGQHDELIARGCAYATLVKAQNLSPDEKAVADPQSSDVKNQSEVELRQSQSLSRQETARGRLDLLDKREDYSMAQSSSIFSTAMKLVKTTPDLKLWYIISLCTCILGAAVYPGQALLLGNVMDVFDPVLDQRRGNFFALMFFVMAIGLLFVYMAMGWVSNHIAQSYGCDVRKRMFAAYLRQDLRFFDRPENTIGSLTSRLDSDAQSLFELMGFNIALIILSLITVIVCAILSIAISWKLGLVGVFAGLPPMLLGGYIRIRTETKMDLDIDVRFSKSASIASESITAIRTVTSLAIEEDVLRRYTNELDSAISESKLSLMSLMLFFSFTQSIEFFVLALGFWWGSKLIMARDIDFYQFIVSFMSVYFSGQGCATMFTFASSFTKANAAANYFFWLCNLEPIVHESDQNRGVTPATGCTSYDFENVQFAYPLAPDNRVLKGISLTVNPGQFVAFVGASGCGKSTMISLIERFYDPISGRITIDNTHNLAELNPKLYRRTISLVQQEPTLFPGSIRDNVALGIDQDNSPDTTTVDDSTIEAACRAANAWDFVSSLPDGLNTPCGQGGTQLSGGQRQRIAIARALIRNPRVILLDEATSALDTESERIVQAALMDAASTANRITIAVAHRLSTIMKADRIFVFYGGRIIEAGTHGSLLAQGGMYTKMCEAQNLQATL